MWKITPEVCTSILRVDTPCAMKEAMICNAKKCDWVFIYRLLVRCYTLKLPPLTGVWSGTKHFVCAHFPPLISRILQESRQSALLTFLFWPLLATHCRCRVLLHVITLGNTFSVGLIWTRDRPVAKNSLPDNTKHVLPVATTHYCSSPDASYAVV